MMGQDSKKDKRRETNASIEMSDGSGVGVEDHFEMIKEGKRTKKHKKKVKASSVVDLEGSCNEDLSTKDYEVVDGNYHKEKEEKKKKNKKRKLESVEDNESNKEIHMRGEERSCLQTDDVKDLGKVREDYDVDVSEKVVKKRKREKKKSKDDLGAGMREMMDEEMCNMIANKDFADSKGNTHSTRTKTPEIETQTGSKGNRKKLDSEKRKREKKKSKDDLGAGMQEMMDEELCNKSPMIANEDFPDSKGNTHSTKKKTREIETQAGNKGKRNKPESVEIDCKDPKAKVKRKKVTFSGEVEVFPAYDGPSNGNEENQEEELVQGKRFSPEEDEIVKESVLNYIRTHDLGEDGLNMVLQCKKYKLKNCWQEIGAILPHRPYTAIYYRAHILFERDENRSWSTEELELVRKFHEEHGAKWRTLADALGKNRVHLKDAWRRIKLTTLKKGHWSQEEYQDLFDLVNMDLRMKAFEEKKTKHGMLRDNISWTAISDKLSTRTDATCCAKWYDQLTSPMVAEGNWANTDDYRLLDALFNLDACCIEDVDWDNLLGHRSGEVCRKRWNQMVSHIGEHGNKSFAEQVEIISKRYCPDILEARETWDNKPIVP